jgi:hypothetical protein
MKRYILHSEDQDFDILEDAIAAAKDMASYDEESIYIYELVGAVHPGKPRWRPTERKERVENSVNPFKKLF